jgi:hypothetical protein
MTTDIHITRGKTRVETTEPIGITGLTSVQGKFEGPIQGTFTARYAAITCMTNERNIDLIFSALRAK